jgi:probable extracellular repeat, HAF family
VLTPPAGSIDVDAFDLNNNGQVVGCSYGPSGGGGGGGVLSRRSVSVTWPCQLVLWDAQGNPTVLGTLGVAGAIEAQPAAINDAGVIVGEIARADGSRQAFVRSAAGAVTLISTPGTQSGAVAINETGMVAGWYRSGSTAAGPRHAFSWSAASGTTDLGTLPNAGAGTESSLMPVAIDAAGDVVGNVYSYDSATGTETQTSTFLYTRAHGIRDLQTLSGIDAVVDVNAQGEILGWANLDASRQPVTWSESRGSLLAVRYGPSYSAPPSSGELHNINSWNEVLDTFTEATVLQNVIWTWDPERYR